MTTRMDKELESSGVGMRRPVPPEPATSAGCRRLDRFASDASLPLYDVSAYTIFGTTGFAIGLAAAIGLALCTGVPLATLVLAVAAAFVSFAVVTRARAWLADSGHVFLENVLLALAAAAAAPWALDEPLAPVLDLIMIGLGTMATFGRLGCLAAGCCHGRPAAWGVRYTADSVVPATLVGVRLFPLQLVDGLWCAVITVVAMGVVISGAPSLTATWWWLLAYGAVRFVLELARGDESRRRLGPLTESQWIAIALLAACILHGEPDWTAPRVVALAVLPIGVLASAWFVRDWLPAPALVLREASTWRALLDRLDARAAVRGTPREEAPWSGAAVTLQRLPTAGGVLCCYTLIGPGLDDDRAAAFAGWVLCRAPSHVVVRAQPSDYDRYDLWLLVADEAPSGIAPSDTDWEVWVRAQAFARAARRFDPPWSSSDGGVAMTQRAHSAASGNSMASNGSVRTTASPPAVRRCT